ncbi:TetR family transcriptional regulator [Solihabitans fulvus]|uniref:TetR family transcriptional regulator n=2 Tax=Solihabitans fulvus TaxID=1892852 RepID=A0A5B2WTA3_9PSEU|nr:TetR family transcriptional regulator [Solihabitans fulvus]
MEPATLAERKRQLVRDALSVAALHAFAFQGFDETTIDQIAAAAGVSRRTFFRYFRSKEDVIIDSLSDVNQHITAELAGRPEGEPPAVALRRAFGLLIDTFTEYPEKSLALANLLLTTPALRARYLDRQYEWRIELAAELARRTGLDDDTDLRSSLLVGVALTAFEVARDEWVRCAGREDLNALVDKAFAFVYGAPR